MPAKKEPTAAARKPRKKTVPAKATETPGVEQVIPEDAPQQQRPRLPQSVIDRCADTSSTHGYQSR